MWTSVISSFITDPLFVKILATISHQRIEAYLTSASIESSLAALREVSFDNIYTLRIPIAFIYFDVAFNYTDRTAQRSVVR